MSWLYNAPARQGLRHVRLSARNREDRRASLYLPPFAHWPTAATAQRVSVSLIRAMYVKHNESGPDVLAKAHNS